MTTGAVTYFTRGVGHGSDDFCGGWDPRAELRDGDACADRDEELFFESFGHAFFEEDHLCYLRLRAKRQANNVEREIFRE